MSGEKEIQVDIDAVPFLGQTGNLLDVSPRIYQHNGFSVLFAHYQFPEPVYDLKVHGFIIQEQSTAHPFIPGLKAEPPRFGIAECRIEPSEEETWLQDWRFAGLNYQELVMTMSNTGAVMVSEDAVIAGYSFRNIRAAAEKTNDPRWLETMRGLGFKATQAQWRQLIAPFNPFHS